jgi:hypothetical protein
LLDYLFAAGSALCATLLIYGGWLCSHHLVNSLRDLLARRPQGATGGAIPKQKEA